VDEMSDSYIMIGVGLVGGAASAIIVYEYWKMKTGKSKAMFQPPPNTNASTATTQTQFLSGMFGMVPNVGNGADYLNSSPRGVYM
jgi:hypothetical protein